MSDRFVQAHAKEVWTLGNSAFSLSLRHRPNELPSVERLALTARPELNWAVPGYPAAPVIVAAGARYSPAEGNVRLLHIEAEDQAAELRLIYALDNGLRATQHLQPSPDKAVWRSWVALHNPTNSTIAGITRFDAANWGFAAGNRQPQCGYVLGWLEGPRVEAPGRPAIPFKYGGWIPKFLYGEGFEIPPPPPGGWQAPVYRLVQERLSRLRLRSGKRSTYENHPWVTVLDPEREGGWFLGFEWSGTWQIEAAYLPEGHATTVSARSDANTHDLLPGQELVSPAAFLGLYAGDWDDAFNLCRRYVDDEIIPHIQPAWPTTLHVYHFHNQPEHHNDEYIRQEIDAAVQAGFETTYVETIWWQEGAPSGEFSIGLGDFRDSKVKFPMGLRAMSDHCHSRDMNFGLWFEIERVDIRTANRLRNPWQPEWLVQQEGYPYRSWCQHVFLLCLGVKAAREWALENLLWAIKEYGIDYIMFDSNEWAVCDDPSHDHGPGDGEWAQTEGYYWVMRELRKAHPDLMIMNSSGGSQRGDFGIARYSNCIHPHDNAAPSAKQRRFMHGTGCMYPTSYQANVLPDYTDRPTDEGFAVGQPRAPGHVIPAERFAWRVMNRLLGYFAIGLEVSALPPFQREILRQATALFKRIRRCTHGDRYVLAGPQVLYEPRYEEADNWEVYQYLSRERDMAVVYFYRCMSPEDTFTVRLRGLDSEATYRVEPAMRTDEQGLAHLGSEQMRICGGASLMEAGLTSCLPRTRNAEIVILTRRPGLPGMG